jgi:UDP-N-acetylglucosamine 2-epimerase (non-hydrolysing)
MIKVLTVIGTRPEAIKLAPVLHQLAREPDTFDSRIVITGQHRELLDSMLELFEIKPHHDLAIMSPRQTLADITLAVIAGLDTVLAEEKPDWVLVQGDTTTVMAASIASFYHKVRLGHVEAGLRTFDKFSPYPEEINRRLTGVLADLHFAPTQWSCANLLREGVPVSHVHLTGNTVIDALQHIRSMDFDVDGTPLQLLPDDKRLILVTAHRNENFGAPMEGIARGLHTLARRHRDIHVVYPMHPNPRARKSALRHLAGLPNVTLLDPLEYHEMVWLLDRVHLVVTDSGGLQEEASAFGTPVLVLRDTTERPEGIEAGIAELVMPEQHAVVAAVEAILGDEDRYERMTLAPCPYGDGRASVRIVNALADRPDTLDPLDHIYERPLPEHPLDGLLREATAGIPRRYANRVLARVRGASNRPETGVRV